MKSSLKLSFVLAALMSITAVSAKVFAPTQYMTKTRGAFLLEEIVPRDFLGWRELKIAGSGVVNPQVSEVLNKIYSQLLNRTYIHESGAIVMLSIAYGEDQRSDMAVHYPEVCYPAQGFQVKSIKSDFMATSIGKFPIKRLETVMGDRRYEPVTYWTTIGDHVSVSGIEKRLIELRYGMKDVIPDGVLFRISTIDKDSERAFAVQQMFIADILSSLSPSALALFVGKNDGI